MKSPFVCEPKAKGYAFAYPRMTTALRQRHLLARAACAFNDSRRLAVEAAARGNRESARYYGQCARADWRSLELRLLPA